MTLLYLQYDVLGTMSERASKRNYARRNETALGPQDRLRLLSKLMSNKTTSKLSYMLYFLCSRMSR